ncbi:MAG: M56 family metallopeptidase, partial [Oscillospiraceae bacterium]|nr:M56 family metallopeptidase [Oscillospiraceae bacterium]
MKSASAVTEMNNTVIHNAKQAAHAAQTAPSQDISAWRVLWLAVMTTSLLYFVIAYIRHLRAFQAAVPVENSFTRAWLAGHPLRRPIAIRESGSITAPLTYGIFRPVILVPVGIDWGDAETLNYVFTHEYIHIRQFDAFLRLVLSAVLCVHWFNPFVWVMVILALRDIELSCDEAVIQELGLENRRAYALALLTVEETRQHFNVFVSGFSKNAAGERIQAIMKMKKPTIRRRAVSVLLVVCASGFFCTSAGRAETGLQETPGLVSISLEEQRQERQTWIGGAGLLCDLQEGDFLKLQITGKGGETVGFFVHTKDSDEARGGWIPLDENTYDLWIEVPESGTYFLTECPIRDNCDNYYADIKTCSSTYCASGELISEHLYGGRATITITQS